MAPYDLFTFEKLEKIFPLDIFEIGKATIKELEKVKPRKAKAKRETTKNNSDLLKVEETGKRLQCKNKKWTRWPLDKY